MLDSKGQRVAAFGKFAGVAGQVNLSELKTRILDRNIFQGPKQSLCSCNAVVYLYS